MLSAWGGTCDFFPPISPFAVYPLILVKRTIHSPTSNLTIATGCETLQQTELRMNYNSLNCKTQSLFKKELVGQPKMAEETKTDIRRN